MNKESKAINLFIEKVMKNAEGYSADVQSKIASVLLQTALQLSTEPITLAQLKPKQTHQKL
jgi:hypothetical protein